MLCTRTDNNEDDQEVPGKFRLVDLIPLSFLISNFITDSRTAT